VKAPRILYLTESFHPVLGGGERHVREVGSRLAASGFPVTVVARRGDLAWPAEETLDGMRVLRVQPAGTGRSRKYAMVLPAIEVLRRERNSYDVVIVPGTRVLGLPALLLARALRKRVVLQAEINGEMSGEIYTWGTAAHRPAIRRVVGAGVALRNTLMRDADAWVAISQEIRRELLRAGVPESKAAYIPHAVDTSRFAPATAEERHTLRRRLGLPEGATLVAYTGRLLRGKGLETLVDAFAAVAPRHPRSHLLIVGSGAGQVLSVEQDLVARVRAAGLEERTTFTGRVECVEDYLRASDVFAFPSLFEALGLSLIEAAACGLACVGSRTGGIVDVIEQDASGFLCPPGDAAAFATALDALLADPARRHAFGRRGIEVARTRFDLTDSVSRYRALLASLLPAGRESHGPLEPARRTLEQASRR
jgi:glycosyltransferase involved in cell wall biosynthesis